jgi:amidohydrolase
MNNVYEKLIEKVDEYKEEMINLSKKIHDYSEVAFKEHLSSAELEDVLEKYGFIVQRGVGSLPTAFKAVYKGKSEHPSIAFLAEYDALPVIGHGCGHNLIAPQSAFAAIALTKVLEEFHGTIVVMGTPAEETVGGKIILVDEGAFDDIDYSIMAHPSSVNEVGRKSTAITGIHIEYFGKSAHSSAPELGINALKAVINTFTSIDLVTQTLPEGINTNGIILDGGKADNIIPDYASCQFTVRAKTRDDLLIALEKIKEIVKASEILTGAKGKMEIEPIYAERYPNMTMELRYKKHMEFLGEEVNIANPVGKFGSSDIGNVSIKMPVIHSYFKIMEVAVNAHSKDFTELATSDNAFNGMIKSCKALAMLGADLIEDKGFRETAYEEYEREVKQKQVGS